MKETDQNEGGVYNVITKGLGFVNRNRNRLYSEYRSRMTHTRIPYAGRVASLRE